MKPTVLLSNFMGGITVPHYLKKKEEPEGIISADILFNKSESLGVGDNVTFVDLGKNVRCFKVTSLEGQREARGDWSFKSEHPTWAQITTEHIGYYDDKNECVVKERITAEKN